METYANNTMLIEGRQKIVVNGEEQEIVLTGAVLGEDVAPDNTVLSTFVADAEISFVGTGVVGDKNKPGIITSVQLAVLSRIRRNGDVEESCMVSGGNHPAQRRDRLGSEH